MPPKKDTIPPLEKATAQAPLICQLCDRDANVDIRHIIKDGAIVKCPFIDVNITHQMGKPADPPVLR